MCNMITPYTIIITIIIITAIIIIITLKSELND